MSLNSLKNLSFKAKFSLIAGVVLVFGLFGTVLISQNQQEVRSRAASDITGDHPGDLVGDDFRVFGSVLGNIIGNRNQVSVDVEGNIYGDSNDIGGNVEGCINGSNNRIVGNVIGGVEGSNNTVLGTTGSGPCPLPGSETPTATPLPPTPSPTSAVTPSPTTVPTPIPTSVPITPTVTPPNPELSFSFTRTNDTPEIDGEFGEYGFSQTIQFGSLTNDMVKVKGLWDGDNVYIAYEVRDSNLTSSITQRDGQVWNDDSIEWFFDTLSNGGGGNSPLEPYMLPDDYQGVVNIANVQYDSRGSSNGKPDLTYNSAWQSVINPTSTGYNVEIKIPWSEIGLSQAPAVDTIMHGSFAANDYGTIPKYSIMWPNYTAPQFNNASKWQNLKLIDSPATSVGLDVFLHGIGKGGDSANPGSGGNPNPLRPLRNVKVEIYNNQNQLILTKEGQVNFDSAKGSFTGTADLGSTLTTGIYVVKVKTDQFLRSIVGVITTLTEGSLNTLSSVALVTGDANGDNILNILDYNLLMGCYSDLEPAISCNPDLKLLTDFDDDGDVNQFDYNLFLRELTNREGE